MVNLLMCIETFIVLLICFRPVFDTALQHRPDGDATPTSFRCIRIQLTTKGKHDFTNFAFASGAGEQTGR